MALDQYMDDTVSQIDTFEEKPSLKNWKTSTDVIADSDRNASSGFDCNICLDCVQDPVVTFCGHLYCWPCIYKWLDIQSGISSQNEKQKPQCPVCKSELSQSSLVPLYGRGQTMTLSEGKAQQVGIVVPRRPTGPRSFNPTTVSQPTYQSYQHPHHPRQFNSIPSSYSSPMFSTSGSALDNTYGIFGEMIYGRMFGNQIENMYTYPNSYSFQGTNNPRMRRHLMQVDKSLNRISFFLFCSLVLCVLLF